MNTPNPVVTIIVATRDRPDDVRRLLPTLREQDEARFELILVDQSTNERTRAIVEACADSRVTYVRQHSRGKSRALDTALRLLRTEYVAFTDDDCTAPPDWLSTWLRLMNESPDAALGFATLAPIPHDEATDFVPAIEFSELNMLRGRAWTSRGLIGMGANMFARRSLFERIGGFDRDLGPGGLLRTGEECELTYRALRNGITVIQSPSPPILHWGVRPRECGIANQLINDGFFAVGAGYGKHLRRGDWQAGSVVIHETVWCFGLVIRAIMNNSRPLHLRRLRNIHAGILSGLRHPLAIELGEENSPGQ